MSLTRLALHQLRYAIELPATASEIWRAQVHGSHGHGTHATINGAPEGFGIMLVADAQAVAALHNAAPALLDVADAATDVVEYALRGGDRNPSEEAELFATLHAAVIKAGRTL